MLINTKKLHYDHESYPDVTIKSYTSMHWLPLSTEAPMQTMVTYTRERIFYAQDEMDELTGKEVKSDDFLSVRDNTGVVSTTLGRTPAERSVAFRLEF